MKNEMSLRWRLGYFCWFCVLYGRTFLKIAVWLGAAIWAINNWEGAAMISAGIVFTTIALSAITAVCTVPKEETDDDKTG